MLKAKIEVLAGNKKTKALVAGTLVAGIIAVGMTMDATPAHAATTFTVNLPGDTKDANTGDDKCDVNPSGTGEQCTLRAAMEQANKTPGADAIRFDIPDDFGAGVKTINVGATGNGPLPAITEQVSIDGYTQPGASPNTLAVGDNAKLLVELNGTSAGFGQDGLVVNASNTIIKGLAINRFSRNGISVNGGGNRVEGNFIGTDPSGTLRDLSKDADGIEVVSGFGNTIGGTTPAARNIISGNSQGVIVSDGSNNSILGNYIGTDKDGKGILDNASSGISILSDNNTIGGAATGSGNVISGNGSDGVFISSASGTRVLGNRIGTSASGTEDLGNIGKGVDITNSSDTFVGDGTPGGANTIAFSSRDGVSIFGSSSTDNRILSNSIFSNVDSGIDLNADGPTANDTRDADTGVNQLQNKPVVTSAKPTKKNKKKTTTIAGTLNSRPNQTFTVQVFSNPSGTEEGKTLIGQKSVTTDIGGDAPFELRVSRSKAPAGGAITATATDAEGNTSEFSAAKQVG